MLTLWQQQFSCRARQPADAHAGPDVQRLHQGAWQLVCALARALEGGAGPQGLGSPRAARPHGDAPAEHHDGGAAAGGALGAAAAMVAGFAAGFGGGMPDCPDGSAQRGAAGCQGLLAQTSSRSDTCRITALCLSHAGAWLGLCLVWPCQNLSTAGRQRLNQHLCMASSLA
jgi:hypothetical protein